jgi:uncharacterized protein YidB (DUF937 family)
MPKSTMYLLDQEQTIAILRWRRVPPKSWIGTGQNQKIALGDLEHVLGSDAIGLLRVARRPQRASARAVDQLTPDGGLLTEQERMV